MKLSHRVLYLRAKPVTFEHAGKNLQLARNMLELMSRENGIGLSASQIGVRKRLFVMKIGDWRRVCFNPEISNYAPELVDWEEGCLSFPGDTCIIKRPDWIDVTYQDHEGNTHQETYQGLAARCFQHELDHLDGLTMWDRYKEQHAEQS